MLTIFPHLLDYGLLSPFLIRVSLGLLGLVGAKQRFSKDYKWLSVFYGVTSIFLIIGLYTQIAVILGFLFIGLDDFLDKKVKPLTVERILFRTFMAVVIISLLFTGPGFLAFDLPL
jgi:uncharacterized membrane protein